MCSVDIYDSSMMHKNGFNALCIYGEAVNKSISVITLLQYAQYMSYVV